VTHYLQARLDLVGHCFWPIADHRKGLAIDKGRRRNKKIKDKINKIFENIKLIKFVYVIAHCVT